ncbi:MAG TPA: nucleotide pyrophosphohydrolase [Accumulibacter sp.]|uniref:nucleotide pyrophosphohydrolase n=1 Tax=Accumulibacter sp. TaxID=2053492 RepID=UPI002D1D8049|nr:nucleotide pyrophosphohydrolase [Accumulibacter sp.]HRF74899.1 nucleotide pyrophosphohydrolase [Accumulibacter sp.]
MNLPALTARVIEFRDQRNWAQFHSLRNLIVSLNLEASELLELTQWKSDAEVAALAASGEGREALRDECADVLIYLLLIAENADIDLDDAARAKLLKNAARYPVDRSYGSSQKQPPAREDQAG